VNLAEPDVVHGLLRRGRRRRGSFGLEEQRRLSDHHLVARVPHDAALEHHAVHERAVRAAEIGDGEDLAAARDDGVLAGNGKVVQHEVVPGGGPADLDLVLRDRELGDTARFLPDRELRVHFSRGL
jgi:hypothetical protein